MTTDFEKILLVDKPEGITSFDVIRRLRKKLGIKKIGHSGTLDPFATGLLVLGVGEGTKELTKLIKLDKEYIAEILLGVQTDTGDITGKKLVQQDVTSLGDLEIKNAVNSVVGEFEYFVPKYSAIKVGGKKLYDLARNGIDFTPPKKMMKVYSVEVLEIKNYKNHILVTVKFFVGSGTYIRTLGEEIGQLLGVPATLINLRRTKVGEYIVENAIKV